MKDNIVINHTVYSPTLFSVYNYESLSLENVLNTKIICFPDEQKSPAWMMNYMIDNFPDKKKYDW